MELQKSSQKSFVLPFSYMVSLLSWHNPSFLLQQMTTFKKVLISSTQADDPKILEEIFPPAPKSEFHSVPSPALRRVDLHVPPCYRDTHEALPSVVRTFGRLTCCLNVFGERKRYLHFALRLLGMCTPSGVQLVLGWILDWMPTSDGPFTVLQAVRRVRGEGAL